MYAERHSITLTTDASGDVIAYSPPGLTGRVLAVIYTIGTIDTGGDITITAEATGQAILALTNASASAVYYPRVQVHGSTGTGLTLDGTRLMVEAVPIVHDRVKVVVAQGGNAMTGTITIIVG